MKQYFIIVFGGAAVIAVCMSISYGGAFVWNKAKQARIKVDVSKTISSSLYGVDQNVRSAAAGVNSTFSDAEDPFGAISNDRTVVNGFKRVIKYAPDPQQDFIIAAAKSLPRNTIPSVTAKGYLVRNMTNSSDAISHNANTLLPIASLTKLVTAIVARKLIPPTDDITITKAIANTEGDSGQLRVGEKLTAADLYYPLLLVSSNDAAEAYAQHYGRTKFIMAMNDFAQSIGAYRTYFNDASGLSPDNVSTANDMATIIDWIEKNDPGIIQTTMLKTKTVGKHTWYNPTHFLNWSYYVGGKNGYTPEANRTGVALFALGKNKDLYAVIVLGSDQRDADMVQLLKVVKE